MNQLSASAYDLHLQSQARQLEYQLQQQALQAMQQGRYDYNYNNPGYYQLLQQSYQASDLRRELQREEMEHDDYDY